jgi:hypothetical protein
MHYIVVFVAIALLSYAAWQIITLFKKSDAESAEIIRKGKESGEI